MAIIMVTEATGGLPNSGRLSGTDGDLVGILDVALPLNGWSIEFSSGNDRVYRPGVGNRFRLCMRDAAAQSGDARLTLVRGAESATTASAWTDPFPTVAKIADASSNWLKSTTANTTARNFNIFVGTTWVAMFVNLGGVTNIWEMQGYWDCPPALSGDSYNTQVATRNTSSATGPSTNWNCIAAGTALIPYSWARSYDATVKSTCGGPLGWGSTVIGAIGNYPPAQGGPSLGIDKQKIATMDSGAVSNNGSATLGIPIRGYIPNLWFPLHTGRGSLNSRDTFTDTAYNPSASFMIFTNNSTSSSGFIIVETTDTWSPP